MGLDVSLYQCETFSEDGEGFESVELPSQKYPDHLFCVGYWRSSYNKAGFNNVLRTLIGKDLYDIIEEAGDSYYIRPEWSEALDLARNVHAELLERLEVVGSYRVQEISYNSFKSLKDETVSSEAAALEIFFSEINKNPNAAVGWQGKHGTFYPKGIEVFGVVEGKSSSILHGDKEAHYLVYKPRLEEGQGAYDWYVQALEIVIETIEYVLAQKDPTQYVLGWSG